MPRSSPSFTLHHEFDAYRASARLRSCAETTRREYGRVLDHMDAEIGDIVTSSIDRARVRGFMDEWAQAGHRAATIRLQVLKNALEPSISDGLLDRALFVGLQRVNRPHDLPEANLAWTDDEVEAVVEHCINTGAMGLARAVGLGRYAAMRRQAICLAVKADRYTDVIRGGHVRRWIRYRSEKGGVWVNLREDGRLTELLDERTDEGDEMLAFNKMGFPWRPRQLNQALARVLKKLAEAGLVRPGLTLHGLRHRRGSELAESGASDAEIMAQLGHTDEQSARIYRRQAARDAMGERAQRLVDQHRLHAARRLQRPSSVKSPAPPKDLQE
jgi:integrase